MICLLVGTKSIDVLISNVFGVTAIGAATPRTASTSIEDFITGETPVV